VLFVDNDCEIRVVIIGIIVARISPKYADHIYQVNISAAEVLIQILSATLSWLAG
jgi:hypothetical protein